MTGDRCFGPGYGDRCFGPGYGVVTYGPDDPKPTDCPTCSYYQCNAGEWVLAKARKGDRIRWRRRPLADSTAELGPWVTGTFMGSMFYDGVFGRAYEDDPDDLVVVNLRPDMGDLVERL